MTEFQTGTINTTTFHSDILERDITFSIYLPEDYTPYLNIKVIFCFDGLDFSDMDVFIVFMKS